MNDLNSVLGGRDCTFVGHKNRFLISGNIIGDFIRGKAKSVIEDLWSVF